MDDLLAATGWVSVDSPAGETAILFLHPATGFDPDAVAKLEDLAGLWGLAQVAGSTGPSHATVGAAINGPAVGLDGLTIDIHEMACGDRQAEQGWLAAARQAARLLLVVTAAPLAAPTPDLAILAMGEHPDITWWGLAETLTQQES